MKLSGHLRKTGKLYITIILTAMLTFLLMHIVQAVTTVSNEPGTESNPLVAKDYVDTKINTLNQQIQTLKQTQGSGGSSLFQVVELKIGQQLLSGASGEIIVRSGTATAVSGQNGDGLSDLTTDDSTKGNLVTGQVIPLNHLLLISRDDGRGIKAVSDKVFILCRGSYTLK